jgi:ABC-type transport system substrate-binding protein
VTAAAVVALLLAPAADALVVGILADPVSLEPHRATDLVSAAVIVNVCDTLVRFRPDGARPEAALATTWATEDNRSWTFTLREGVRFHDGAPLDADAVVANLENVRKSRGFDGTAARVGPHVVSVTLDRPNAAFLATLSQPSFSLQSPRALAAGSPRPVGTGPFRLTQARPGLVQLEANAEHWNGRPRLRVLAFRRFANEEALAGALIAGEVDVTTAVGQARVGRLRESTRVTLDSQTGLSVAFLSVNNERPPFGDVRVRQAIARVVDRGDMVASILEGHGEPARNPLPPSLWGYGARTKELVLDRAVARRLLAEAGLAHGFETTLLVVDSPRPYLPAPMQLAARIRDDLAKVGIRVRLREAASWREYVDLATRGDYELCTLGWLADTTDPNDFLSALLDSESIGLTNRSRYRSDEMDALLKRGRRATDPQTRLAVYRDAQELFQRDMPWIPLYHVSAFTAYRRSVRGIVVGSTGLLRYDDTWKSE